MKSFARVLSLLIGLGGVLSAQSVLITVDADADTTTISRHIYGHFAEHLGRSIYGRFYVGDTSEIPNREGIRTDVVEALRERQIPNLRWPGGCFADTYHWKDGIGPQEERPSILNVGWGNVKEDSSFGTHNFFNLCEMLDTELYLSANVGSGTPQELSDWIRYTTHLAGSSPMPDLRAENGREEPWDVRFWGIGNESWGCGGNMRPEYYADLYRRFATFMSGWQNDELYRIASGASGGDYNWTEVLMQNIPKNLIEAIALHHYSVIDWCNKGPATGFTGDQYFLTMTEALRMEELIEEHVTMMDKYDPDKRVDLLVDEWGGRYNVEAGTNPGFLYQQNTMRDAMLAAATLNIFNNHADRVKMANIAQAINVTPGGDTDRPGTDAADADLPRLPYVRAPPRRAADPADIRFAGVYPRRRKATGDFRFRFPRQHGAGTLLAGQHRQPAIARDRTGRCRPGLDRRYGGDPHRRDPPGA